MSMKRTVVVRWLFAIVAVAVIVVPTLVLAQRIFINEVEVPANAMRNRTFTSVDAVRFDGSGDIHIDAPRYNISVQAGQAVAPPPTNVTYQLAAISQPIGSIPYEVTVFLNGQPVDTFRFDRGNSAQDVSHLVVDGTNRARFVCRRVPNVMASRVPTAQFRVVMGPGTANGGTVSVDRIDAAVVIEATEQREYFVQEIVFEARPL